LQGHHEVAALFLELHQRQAMVGKRSDHWVLASLSLDGTRFSAMFLQSAYTIPQNFSDAASLLWTTRKQHERRTSMQGKVVIVTGASGALGKVVVQAALARGARVAGIDHAKSGIPVTSDRIELGAVDLSDAARAKQAIEAVVAHFGCLDVLINIAGAFSFETVAEGDPATWQRLYAINVLTALNTSRAAIPHLAASRAGRIVNIGAIGALQAARGMGPYAASKAGVHRLTEALAAELKGKVTVNAVLPSVIDTPANRAAMPNADFATWVSAQELANVILFLAGDEASAVTGALIPVSGRV
jgi:NAD(P)-dependent dehydrogenase (short-subunit alcohol dehydrogenase family)